jgi:uncharacterized protein YpuA (DUF1002 family)
MKLIGLFAALAVGASAQMLDFSSLEKLEAKAKEVNKISLDENQLRAAMQMLPENFQKGSPDQLAAAKRIISGLQSVEVRNLEFDRSSDFTDADLSSIRSQISKLKGFTQIIDSKEKGEHSQIYLRTENDHPTGLAIINSEDKELNIVLIRGPLSLSDLGKLGGIMGLPNIQLGPADRP